MTNQSSSYVRELGKNDHTDIDSLVHNMNADKVRLFIPVVVFVSLMMVLGLLGNAFVCYFYTFKEKKSTNTFFIVVLSVYDLLTCFITMPTDIATLVLYYTFVDNVACKTLRFVNYVLIIASILTLVVIATDRYKRICCFARPQMGIPHAHRVSVIVIVLALLMALPSLFIYGSNRVPVVNNLSLDIYGHKCTTTKETAQRVYVWTYFFLPLTRLLYSLKTITFNVKLDLNIAHSFT